MRSGKMPRQFGMSFQVPRLLLVLYKPASRIAKEVIKQNAGDNSFLGTQEGRISSTGVRRDFNETAKGLSRKDNKKLGAPTA
jgi:hypothetical protein